MREQQIRTTSACVTKWLAREEAEEEPAPASSSTPAWEVNLEVAEGERNRRPSSGLKAPSALGPDGRQPAAGVGRPRLGWSSQPQSTRKTSGKSSRTSRGVSRETVNGSREVHQRRVSQNPRVSTYIVRVFRKHVDYLVLLRTYLIGRND